MKTTFKELTEENFVLYAAKVYTNPECESDDEFYNDLKRINYIKKLLNKYISKGELKTRLILNHITVLHNVFGIYPTAKMLFFKLDEDLYPALKTFLVSKYAMPKSINTVNMESIPLDVGIINTLREL